MSHEKPKKRAYNSRRRKEQARQTKRQIVDAARALFLKRGYTGTTVEAIADQAGVAVETVYAVFGNKRAILTQLFDVSLVGDDHPVPLLARQGPQATMRETDQQRQIAMFANDVYTIMSRMAPLFELISAAAKSEPEIAEMYQNMLSMRVNGMLAFVRALGQNGPLRAGVTPESAAETVWALTSGGLFTILTGNRGWDEARFKTWLIDALTRLLLP